MPLNGLDYVRETRDSFWIMKPKDNCSPDSPPHVVCQCGGHEFTLRYGSYEILATCVKCGLSERVYSG